MPSERAGGEICEVGDLVERLPCAMRHVDEHRGERVECEWISA
jgi:hypothetical protein